MGIKSREGNETMPPIKIHRVGDQQPMHPPPQIWPVRLRDQMKMVAHQNETQNRRLKAFRRFTEQLDKASAISLVVKNRLARVAPGTEMVNRIFEFNAQRPRHLSRIATAPTNVKCLGRVAQIGLGVMVVRTKRACCPKLFKFGSQLIP